MTLLLKTENLSRRLEGEVPTGNLDTASGANVQNILRDLAHRRNHAVIVVTHDQAFAETADRIIHIVDGAIVGQG